MTLASVARRPAEVDTPRVPVCRTSGSGLVAIRVLRAISSIETLQHRAAVGWVFVLGVERLAQQRGGLILAEGKHRSAKVFQPSHDRKLVTQLVNPRFRRSWERIH